MKVLVENVDKEGLESLLGRRVILLCANYFYTGKLVGVNVDCVKQLDPAIVYETGEWTAKAYKDEQKLGMASLYVQISAIEAYGEAK